jgi:hypothetical protein
MKDEQRKALRQTAENFLGRAVTTANAGDAIALAKMGCELLKEAAEIEDEIRGISADFRGDVPLFFTDNGGRGVQSSLSSLTWRDAPDVHIVDWKLFMDQFAWGEILKKAPSGVIVVGAKADPNALRLMQASAAPKTSEVFSKHEKPCTVPTPPMAFVVSGISADDALAVESGHLQGFEVHFSFADRG